AVELQQRATPLEFLQAVYRNEGLPISIRMRAAIEAAPFIHPKLSVSAQVNSEDFAAALDRATKRSAQVLKVIEPTIDEANSSTTPIETNRPSNGHKPMIPDRRYRRW